MSASAWLRAGGSAGLVSAVALVLTALAPVLVRSIHPDAAIRTGVDLVCLFLPTPSDWTAHLGSYALLSLLVVGALRGLISLVMQTYRTRQAIRRLLQFAQPPDPSLRARFASLRLDGRIDLIRAAAPLAFCYGFFRPRICVSTGLVSLLQADELTALLWHEHYQLLRRDPLKMAVGRAWSAAFFFVPLIHILYRQYLISKEVEADRYACGQQGRTDALAEALWVLVERSAVLTREDTPTLAAGSGEALEARLAHLLGQPAPHAQPWRSLLLSGALLGLLVGAEWIFVQAGVTNVLWYLEHTPLGRC